MKKSHLVLAIVIALVTVFSACNKDEFTEQDSFNNELALLSYKDSLMKDSIKYMREYLKNVGGIIEYSIKVHNASSNTTLKSTESVGVEGVVIAIAQNGYIEIDTTDEFGFVIFKDMRIGTANVTIQSDDYTDVSYIADITPTVTGAGNGAVYHVSSQIAVFAIEGPATAVISGQMTIDTDLTNASPEKAAGITVVASIAVDDEAFKQYFVQPTPASTYLAEILEMSYADAWLTTTTNANGEYSLRVPSAPDGLPYKVSFSDFATNQKLLLNNRYSKPANGVQTVRTLFGEDVSPSSIPTAAPAFVTFAMPTGNPNLQPTVEATAQAVVSESGIQAIHVTNPGKNYTQAPRVRIRTTNGGVGTGAEATAIVSNGIVSGITVTKAGKGYEAGKVEVDVLETVEEAIVESVVTYSVTDINVNNPGSGYQSTPAVSISGDGTGATAQAIMTGYVSAINIVNRGAGYIQTPEVLITGGNGVDATAYAQMENYGPIARVEVTSTPYFLPGTIDVDFSSSYGTGANGNAILDLTNGRVQSINIVNGGSGYTVAPAVTINGGGGTGARAYTTINGGGNVNGIYIVDYGTGYSTTPTIQIAGPGGGGTTASASALLYFPLQRINITSSGDGYATSGTGVTFNQAYSGTFNYNVIISRKIAQIVVSNSGSGYTSAPTVSIVPQNGDTPTTTATATSAISQRVDQIAVSNGGSGYLPNNIIVSIAAPANGTPASASANVGKGVLNKVNVLYGGSGYTAAPNVVFTGGNPSIAATATATVTNGRVTSITVASQGEGYSSNPSVAVQTYSESASAEVRANLTAGQIQSILVTDPGEGYTIAPVVEIEDLNGVGTGAVATATIGSNGKVVSIQVTNPGSGYYSVPMVKLVVPNYVSPAMGTVVVNESGVITDIVIDDAGMGYADVPSVTITASVPGLGSGAQALAVISNGKVVDVKVTNGGSNYKGQNLPGYFGTYGNIGYNAPGRGFSVYSPSFGENAYHVVSGNSYVVDAYLGTGLRVEEF